jgi:N-hydroxyarylamine O-acetyltransferase
MNPKMIEQYFQRIGLIHQPEINESTLRLIHHHQHRAIPFENLAILNGESIDITQQAIFEKLVVSERGGYCQELNGLLFNVLSYLGFTIRPLLARVHFGEQPTGHGHRINLVTIDEQQWIVDAGFGTSTPRAPLPLIFNQEIKTDLQTFRFIKDPLFGNMLQTLEEDAWKNMYSLDMNHVVWNDLEYGNHFTSTHPSSLFTQNCVVARPTDEGITTLFNRTLKVRQGSVEQEIELDNESDFYHALKQHFGLEPKISYQAFIPFLDKPEA